MINEIFLELVAVFRLKTCMQYDLEIHRLYELGFHIIAQSK